MTTKKGVKVDTKLLSISGSIHNGDNPQSQQLYTTLSNRTKFVLWGLYPIVVKSVQKANARDLRQSINRRNSEATTTCICAYRRDRELFTQLSVVVINDYKDYKLPTNANLYYPTSHCSSYEVTEKDAT